MFYTNVTLETKDVILVTNYCKAIKVIKNVESNFLSESCDIQVEDKTGYRFYILVNKGSFRFFNDFSKVSYDLVTENSYINCSDKDPEEVKYKY
jgi:hypothetical protein